VEGVEVEGLLLGAIRWVRKPWTGVLAYKVPVWTYYGKAEESMKERICKAREFFTLELLSKLQGTVWPFALLDVLVTVDGEARST
jgi:hypothetical protein